MEDTFDDVDDPYTAGGPRTGLLFEETVLPSPNSTDLLRTTRTDYMLRFDSRTTHIAELFQENRLAMSPINRCDLDGWTDHVHSGFSPPAVPRWTHLPDLIPSIPTHANNWDQKTCEGRVLQLSGTEIASDISRAATTYSE